MARIITIAAALLALALGLCTPAGAKDDAWLKDAALNAGAEIILYYSVCTKKPFSPGARGSLLQLAEMHGEESFKREIEGRVNALMPEWLIGAKDAEETAHGVFPSLPKCMDARSHWGRGLLPEGERD
jgi:hypothetical protein